MSDVDVAVEVGQWRQFVECVLRRLHVTAGAVGFLALGEAADVGDEVRQ
jgi:hypothetical protein